MNLIPKLFCRGQTALHKAAAYRWRDICCMLVARGAKLDIPDHRGNTPRTLAIQSDDADLAAYLHSKLNNNRYYKTGF